MVILTYPLWFEDNNGTYITMKPLEDPLSPYRIKTENSTTITVLLDFDFTQKVYLYTYYKLDDIIEALGQIGAAVAVVMYELTLFFICMFFLDMVRIIYGRYKNDWTEVRNVQLKENLSSYKKVIRCLQKRNTSQDNEGGGFADDINTTDITQE